MATNRTFNSVELVKLEYEINKSIKDERYNDAAALMRDFSGLYDFEIKISDQEAEILSKINIPNSR